MGKVIITDNGRTYITSADLFNSPTYVAFLKKLAEKLTGKNKTNQ